MSLPPARLLAEAQALHQAGRLDEAARRYESVLKARSEDGTALMLLGALRLQQGDAQAAAKLLRRAANRRPTDPTPRYNLGIALNRLGQHDEAIAALDTVTAAHPDHADAWKALGDARHAMGDAAGALAAFRRAVALRPIFPTAQLNLGSVLLGACLGEEAEACLRVLVEQRPDDARAWNNLGLALMLLQRMGEAEAAFRRALELAPDHDKAVENLAKLLSLRYRHAESADLYRHALDLQRQGGRPLSADALAGLLQAHELLCSWDGMPGMLREVLAREAEGIDPFVLLSQDVPPQRIRRAGQIFGRKATAGVLTLPARSVGTGRRIRIGYVSADLRDHAVATLIAEVLESHDRAAFAVHAYATKDGAGSRYHARLTGAVETWRAMHDQDEEALARRIAADEIDILVDLGGWTANHSLRAMAMRPAPVQVSWLGYAASLGVPFMDYVLLDPVAAPPGCEAEFSEQIVRLPDCFQPNDRQRPVGAAPDRTDEGLPAEGFVFAAFASPNKITAEVWDAWMRVLSSVPGSVLWTKTHDELVRIHLRREAEARGIAEHRIVFATWAPDNAAHLGRYKVAGLALDTWPYGSHTTASDALWSGCPLIALRGRSLAARISSSVLTAAGLPDLVAEDVDGFVAMAVRYATDPTALAALRARVAACRDSALFDTPRFVRHLEAAYRAMHARAVDGLPPAPITIAPLPRDLGRP